MHVAGRTARLGYAVLSVRLWKRRRPMPVDNSHKQGRRKNVSGDDEEEPEEGSENEQTQEFALQTVALDGNADMHALTTYFQGWRCSS